jgi:hypothetical protein
MKKRKKSALRRRYGRAVASKKTFIHIGHGYRVTDAYANDLAKRSGRKTSLDWLSPGYEMLVRLPNGVEAWLARTPVHTDAYGFKPPKRGWAWYVRPRSSSDERAFYEYVKGAP